MVAKSQNGWIANDSGQVTSQLVPGTQVKISVRKDAAGQLLLEVACAFDRLVQDIDNARGALDDWGYAQRPIRGGSTLSNHASGTAIDLNATKHPLGTAPSANFTAAQIAQIRRIVVITSGVVRWGGDYTGRKDGMHFEINDGKTLADCARALAAMRQFNASQQVGSTIPEGGDVQLPTLKEGDGVKGTPGGHLHWYVLSAQALCNVRGLSKPLAQDGSFGPTTTAMVKELQARTKLTADGVIGPLTWGWLLGNDAPDYAK